MSLAGKSAEAATTIQSHGWWLAGRASGLVALVLITISVGLGLAMAGKVMRRPGLSRKLLAIHEYTALAGLVGIAVHGITLLGDPWLNPGLAGIAVPFSIAFRPLFVAFGIIGGYLGALLGLSFYLRKRIGPRLWRKAHRATVVVYLLGLVHALGSGTDASTVWFRWWVLMTAPVLGGLFVYRVFAGGSKRATDADRLHDGARSHRPAMPAHQRRGITANPLPEEA